MIQLDGAQGEGGGQILRSALALAAVTGTPFRIAGIRARRARPGLQRQHLAAVAAAATVCGAACEGAVLGATELTFRPGPIRAAGHQFDVGGAGSACLVLQTILPPLLVAGGTSVHTFTGGTHNPQAPTFDFLALAFLPVVRRLGGTVEATLERHGFHPGGGGRFTVRVTGGAPLRPLDLLAGAPPSARRARVLLANLPGHVAERELHELKRRLGWRDSEYHVEHVDADGPGNVISIELLGEPAEVVSSFGAIGVPAEVVARRAAGAARRHLASGAPVSEHLADQLLVPFGLAGGGSFRTARATAHCRTNATVVAAFLPVTIDVAEDADGATVTVSPR